MRIIEIVPTLEQQASGPAASVSSLAASLAGIGNSVLLLSVGGVGLELQGQFRHQQFDKTWDKVPLAKHLWLSRGLNEALWAAAPTADVIHSNGLWVMPNVCPSWAAQAASTPLVLSPRGTLSPIALARSKWLKRFFWTFVQGPAVRQARCLHATSEQEYRDIREFGLRCPVAVIPNGIDLPVPPAVANPRRAIRRLLYLGRLHPIKGIDDLLKAWQRVQADFPDWEMRLVGPDEGGYQAQLERLASELSLERFAFVGPRFGVEKWAEYVGAHLYILPSKSESFGMSVAEAMAAGLPVITTTGTPWQDLDEREIGWCVSPNVGGIEIALRKALAQSSKNLVRMGDRARSWMQQDFSWPDIARSMEAIYRWLVEGGEPPRHVRLD